MIDKNQLNIDEVDEYVDVLFELIQKLILRASETTDFYCISYVGASHERQFSIKTVFFQTDKLLDISDMTVPY
jgi:hypothetical protein